MAVKDLFVKSKLAQEFEDFPPAYEDPFQAQDPFHPVLKNSPSLTITSEQDFYIKQILETACSDSAFAKRAYVALQYVLSGADPVAPVVSSLSPNSAVVGDPVFDIHVIGTGFTAESIILFNAIEEPTTFVSETELTTGVNMPLWTAPAVVPVAVKNGDLVSPPVNFEFTAPVVLRTPSDEKKKVDLGPELKKEYEIKSTPEHKGQEKK